MPIFCRMEVVNVAVELNDRQERFCQAYVFEDRVQSSSQKANRRRDL